MKRQILTCLAASTLCGLSTHAGAEGFATWNANSGGFSYAITNLSGQSCTLVAYGATPNQSAPPESPANVTGWNGLSSEYSSPGFFNNTQWDDFYGDEEVIFYVADSPMQQIYSITGQADDPTSWKPNDAKNYPYQPADLSNGASFSFIEPTIQIGGQPNPAAAGDSWSITCDNGDGSNDGSPVVMANLASAADSLGSGLAPGTSDYFVSNALINPPAPGSCASDDTEGNACGMGFVGSEEMVFNLNQNSADGNYQPTGGLWWGVENPNTQASLSLVPAMFPVNLAAYTQAQQESNNGNTQYQTYIYGGHLTFAIGDPFVISSFAAKTLWYLATTASFSLNDNTFSEGGAGINQFSAAVNAGLFPQDSYAATYINGLMKSTAQAGYAVNQAIIAASTPNDKESFWGKVFSALFNVTMSAIDTGVAVATGGESAAAQVAIQTSVNTATGALGTPVDNAINNAFTSNTTMGPPATQNAPLSVNSTFASSNLLGLMLTNFYVQYQVNTFSGNTSNPNPLWSNAAMYSDQPTNEAGNCSNQAVTNNLYQTNVTCYDSTSGNYVLQSAVTPTPAYSNVCENVNADGVCTNAGTTDSQLNIWDAIMTGSTVGADSNGMLVLQNPSTWSFAPPTLIADQSIASMTTNFNLNTGALSLTQYIVASPVPEAQPYVNSFLVNYGGGECEALTYSPLQVSYDATTGMLSTAGWKSGCTADPDYNQSSVDDYVASLNMATCDGIDSVLFAVSGG
ncbi:MAG: hypothetical protein EOM24_06770, partial [Chloroflexia bacterium]|nr:hypothetical protein [Chloroflexia bacterium]